ncbi:MAG: DUF456 domain-containing protein [Formivibrio sp.]|nr:DUF456 domain-containing protein [Formivibrio sp.]
MEIAGWILAGLLILGGLAGTLLPILPATPMIFAGMLLAGWIDQFQHVGWITFIILSTLVIASMSLDFIAGSLGAKKAGASPEAIWGALIGSVLGILGGLPGLLLGPFLGAAAGELWARQDALQAGKVGIAAMLGFILGAVAKVAAALAMLGVFTLAWFW